MLILKEEFSFMCSVFSSLIYEKENQVITKNKTNYTYINNCFCFFIDENLSYTKYIIMQKNLGRFFLGIDYNINTCNYRL